MQDRELESLVRSVVERVVSGGGNPGDATVPRSDGTAARRVAVGADHGGYPMKEDLKQFLPTIGWEAVDMGAHSTEAVDYPDFAAAVAREVAEGRCAFGIMVDGAGIGSSMAANKVPGARAALCYDLSTANNAREHNNANVLTLGAGLIGAALARQIVKTFLSTGCTEERHLKRVAKIDALDGAGARVR